MKEVGKIDPPREGEGISPRKTSQLRLTEKHTSNYLFLSCNL